MSTLRTFIALDLPERIRQSVEEISAQVARAADGIKLVEGENLHLTLKFLGEVQENDTYQVCRIVQGVAGEFEPFEISYRGAGAFPDTGRPRTLWVGVDRGNDELVRLQQALEDALTEMRFRRETRRFQPHLTFARVRRPSPQLARVTEILEANADFQAGATLLEVLFVYASELTTDGPIYTVLGRAALGE